MTVEKVQEVIDWHIEDENGNEYSVEQLRDYSCLEFQYTIWDQDNQEIEKSDPIYLEILKAIEDYE
ncbi:MAG: hypothetical protein RLZZ196_3066 [Bacteroidota bacterium]|jgi:hypothetical protein